MIEVTDADRIRTIRLNRPEAKNAMNEAMWDAFAEALLTAGEDSSIAVVVVTGSGDSFSAGADLFEMAQGNAGTLVRGKHGFTGVADALVTFPKPLICAINGLGLGFGATIVGLSDLVFMSTAARLKCPFTSLAVAPELASSATIPWLVGRQNAMWMLLSSEWLSAEECLEMGLAFKVCEPDDLLEVAMQHARVLATKPISSLVESKAAVMTPLFDAIADARTRENAAFGRLLGAPANQEALAAFAERREPDFARIDAEAG